MRRMRAHGDRYFRESHELHRNVDYPATSENRCGQRNNPWIRNGQVSARSKARDERRGAPFPPSGTETGTASANLRSRGATEIARMKAVARSSRALRSRMELDPRSPLPSTLFSPTFYGETAITVDNGRCASFCRRARAVLRSSRMIPKVSAFLSLRQST